MNNTPNINLSTYTSDPNDRFNLMVTFNENMNKIDTAIGNQNDQIEVIEATAGTAVTTANTASTTASNALSVANNAGTVANEALEASDSLSEINNFTILTTDWIANTDITTNTDYPFICTKTSDKFTNTSRPIYQILGSGAIPTVDELIEAGYISVVNFTESGVTMFATEKPLNTLNLVVKGV
jgi:hypothetical protein